jgi:hypothetical protein
MFSAGHPRLGTCGSALELEGTQGKLQGRRDSSKIARMAVDDLGQGNLKAVPDGVSKKLC